MDGCTPNNISGSNLNDSCSYINTISGCALSGGFINYFRWQYCGFDNRIAPTALMIVWFIFLLIAIATTADSFLAPCLVVVAKLLRMSHNLAGVTLLALGNGAPDVFSSLSAIISVPTPNVGLSFGAILGAGVMVNTITAGSIMILVSFELMHRPILKDLIFYFIALIWCMIIFIRRQIELWSSLVFLILYIIYILVTVISRFLFLKKQKSKTVELPIEIEEIKVINENNEIVITSPGSNNITRTSSKAEYDNPTFAITNVDEMPNDISFHFSASSSPISLKHELGKGYDNSVYTNEVNNDHHNVSKKRYEKKLSNESSKKDVNHENLGRNNFNHGIFLNVPRFEMLNQSGRSYLSETSSVDERPHKKIHNLHKSNIMRTTSHRSIGSFAKIIIENELQKKQQKEQHLLNEVKCSPSSLGRSSSLVVNKLSPKTKIRFYSMNEGDKNSKDTDLENSNHFVTSKRLSISSEQNENIDINIEKSQPVIFPGIIKHFLLTILPVDIEEWKEQSIPKNILSVIQSPSMFIFTLTVPIVEEGAFLKGWCKVLNCVHCLTAPVISVILVQGYLVNFGKSTFNLVYLFIILGVIAAVVVAMTSKADKPPIYQPVFAFVGLITSVIWIYEIANEIVNILTVFGVVLSISETILGLSVLAFANSIGDLVADITLAKKNYPRIGYSASIGGPLFNLLLGIGIPFSIKTISGPINIPLKSESIVLIFTILLITAMNIICLPLMKFRPKRFYGIILIIIYAVFFILVILFAGNIIKITF